MRRARISSPATPLLKTPMVPSSKSCGRFGQAFASGFPESPQSEQGPSSPSQAAIRDRSPRIQRRSHRACLGSERARLTRRLAAVESLTAERLRYATIHITRPPTPAWRGSGRCRQFMYHSARRHPWPRCLAASTMRWSIGGSKPFHKPAAAFATVATGSTEP
jgi:hypothetical protein